MEITLAELASILRGSAPAAVTAIPTGQFIVILDRGFVYAGNVSPSETEGWAKISDAKNIRLWGATKGLGELRNGPLSGTKIDECDEILAPIKSIIHMIPCRGF